MMTDVRDALRMLIHRPGFTLVAVFTLALGIGANVTIFALIHAFFFQPLPVKDPHQLVLVLQKSDVWKMPHGHSWLDYRDYRSEVETFSDALATLMQPAHLSLPGRQPERAWIEAVSGNYFAMLGVVPGRGRLFHPGEGEQPGADPILVLSHDYWQSRLGGDPSVVGGTLNVNGQPFTIVGVAPAAFGSAQWGMAVHAFVPASMLGRIRADGDALLEARGAPVFKVMARLREDATLAQARAEVELVARRLAADFPQEHKGADVFLMREQRSRPEPTFSELMPLVASVFMAMVLLVLLIACANVANLMFSRALVRRKEMGIRIALGASRRRLVRQLLAESIALGLLAGAAGLVLSAWSAGLLAGFSPAGDMPVRSDDQTWSWPVFGFTVLVSVGAGIATGLVPALRATRVDPHEALKEGSGAALASRRHPFRSILVVSQVAVCLVVLVCGGLFLRSLQQVAALDLGFRTDRLLMASLDLELQGYDEARGRRFHRELIARVGALPGVRAASLAYSVPFDYQFAITHAAVEEMAGDEDSYTAVHFNRVDPLYFGVIGTPLLRGRGFTEADDERAPRVAIVNATMAERFWPGREALGRRFRLGREGDLWEVAGIAANARYVMLGEEPRPYFYVPLRQDYASPVTLHVRTEGHPAGIAPAVRGALEALDPHLPVYNVRSMEQHLEDSAFAMMPLRVGAAMAGVQGLVALLLAVMGIYGLVSYLVSQRTREIGIRMTLGARTPDIFRLVVGEGARLVVVGMAIGLLAALALARVISGVLHGLTPPALPVILAVSFLLAAVALLACYVPARRAARVDPMVALRYE